MTCREAKGLIAESLPGDLDPARHADLAAHLDLCPECRHERAALESLWMRLGQLPVPEPSPALDARWQTTLDVLVDSVRPAPRPRWSFWPQRPAWQFGIACASLVIGVALGVALERNTAASRENPDEIAKLREEIAGTRAMVALSLLREASASERLRGVDYGGRIASADPQVAAALVDAVRHDPSVNVRLAAIDVLSNAALSNARGGGTSAAATTSLARALTAEESPMVQAALVDYLADARDRQAIGTIQALAARPGLDPAVRERTRFAIESLSH